MMKIQADSILSRKNQMIQSKPSFKMNNASIVKEGVQYFIKETKSDAVKARAMFNRIQNHLNQIKGDTLYFEIQPTCYIGGAVNIKSFFKFSQKEKVALANKYKKSLTRDEYRNLSGSGYGTTMYVVNDLTKPIEIFQMSSPRRGEKFNLTLQDDKTIADIVERSFPVEKTEEILLLKMIRRPHNIFTNIFRWLDTHGPSEPPIY